LIVGYSIKTLGGFDEVYPDPGFVIVNEVTIPDIIEEVASAVVTTPTVFAIVTEGEVVNPNPPLPIEIEDIVPPAETTAVADAPTKLS
jgi:hypothetical protein